MRMQTDGEIGANRTGAAASPKDSQDVARYAEESVPSSDGSESTAMEVRAPYLRESGPVGTMPPAASMKGAVLTVARKLQGRQASVLLDKLGERLAFERAGVRLYEAMIGKREAVGLESPELSPALVDLKAIHDDEVAHFRLVWEAIESLGGDPTAVTPCADAAGVKASGLLQTMLDPRTDLAGGLEVLLAVELMDRDGWELLIELSRSVRQEQLAAQFQEALSAEERHLTLVREWVLALLLEKAGN